MMASSSSRYKCQFTGIAITSVRRCRSWVQLWFDAFVKKKIMLYSVILNYFICIHEGIEFLFVFCFLLISVNSLKIQWFHFKKWIKINFTMQLVLVIENQNFILFLFSVVFFRCLYLIMRDEFLLVELPLKLFVGSILICYEKGILVIQRRNLCKTISSWCVISYLKIM